MPVIMLCYMVNETWWMQLRLQITWVSQKGDCPGGTILITEPYKSRFLWLAAEWEARETWWTRRACYVVAGLRMDRDIREGMRVALRSWEWDSGLTVPKETDLSPIAAWNWMPPTTWLSLEAHPSPDESPAWPAPWCWPWETLSKDPG